jgi:hypothetical protein
MKSAVYDGEKLDIKSVDVPSIRDTQVLALIINSFKEAILRKFKENLIGDHYKRNIT